jgi:polysaccharide export outer membrane protein
MMSFVRAILLGLALFALGLARIASAVSPDYVSVAPADRDKVLGAGDIVTLEILEDKAAPVPKRVSDTGDLDVPYIGRVHVAGRNCSEAAAQISKLLEAEYYFTATVRLAIDQVSNVKANGIAGKIYLSGDVKAPGPQEIPPGEKLTVSGAVVKAGGGTQFADLRKTKVTRKNKDGTSKTIIVDVKAVLEQGKLEQDVELMDGDFVFVPRRLFTW